MEIIIADANIFVYLFNCNLLNTFLSNEIYTIKISKAVFNEITNPNKRIARDFPELRKIILDSRHNKLLQKTLDVVDIQQAMEDLFAISIYYELEHNGELDIGEIESIPLAIELKGRFISNDDDAIQMANKIQQGLGVEFMPFCEEINKKGIISKQELLIIQKFMDNY